MKHRSTSYSTRSIAGTLFVALAAIAGVSCERATADPLALEAKVTPAELVQVAGNEQVAEPGSTLPIPATVRAVDARGNPVRGVPVAFTVTQGGGSAASAGTETDAEGLAQAVWTLGSAGPQGLRAEIPAKYARGGSRSIAFSATARSSGTVEAVQVTPALDTVFVNGGDIALSVTALSATGDTLAGLPTQWSSSDTAVARVDGNGRVRGYRAGSVTVTAAVEGVTGSARVRVETAVLGRVEISTSGDTVLTTGETITLQAAAVGADGAPMEGATIEWTSLNPDIATVDSMGTLLARSAGAVLIVATAVGCEPDTAGFSVEPPPVPTNPASVTDLAVSDVTSNTATLRWTAVSDGNGGVARYAVRYGTPTLNWGDAYATEQVVTASAVGETVTFTYTGLASGAGHQFRLVPFRGTLNQDAIFGDYSNLASATTESSGGEEPPPSGPAVASVTVSPGSYTFTQLGQTLQIGATARDASGNTVSADIAWTSTNPSVVSVDNMGIATARASGSALIIATSVCCGPADTMTAQVQADTPPPSTGEALFTDDFDSYAVGESLGGHGANGFTWGNPAYADVTDDIAHSGSRSLKFYYGPTEPNGASHWWSEQRFSHPAVQEYWVEYYIYFPDGTEGLGSARYQHANNSTATNNKFFAFWADQYGTKPAGFFQMWYSGAGDSEINVARTEGPGDNLERYPRTNNNGMFVSGDADRGRWIRTRIHIRMADYGQSNGLIRLWKDNSLLIDVTNDPFYGPDSSHNYLRNGYLLGYDNARFAQTTFIYIDSFRMYTSNPGW